MQRATRLPLLVPALLAACATPAPSVDPEPAPPVDPVPVPAAAPQEPAEWSPPEPEPDGFDWIRLTNGEWLKGELVVLRKDSLEFESDELGDLKLDWDDVAEFRTPRDTSVRLNDGRILIGTLRVVDGETAVATEAGEVRFPRGDIYTLLPGGSGRGRSLWSGTLSLGFTGRSGNNDQVDSTLYFQTRRRTPKSRFTLTTSSAYSKANSVVVTDNQRLDTDWRQFVNRRTYLVPLSLTMLRDRFQNIDLQAVPGVFAGYQLIDDADLEWSAEAGLGAQYTEYDDVLAGQDDEHTTGVGLFSTQLETDLTAKLELTLRYDLQVPFDRQPNHHAELRSSLDLWRDLDLDIAFIWDHQGEPVPDNNGTTPDKNDYRLTVGLGFDF